MPVIISELKTDLGKLTMEQGGTIKGGNHKRSETTGENGTGQDCLQHGIRSGIPNQ